MAWEVVLTAAFSDSAAQFSTRGGGTGARLVKLGSPMSRFPSLAAAPEREGKERESYGCPGKFDQLPIIVDLSVTLVCNEID